MTVAQFSYVSEYLPKVFPVHLRGTGSASPRTSAAACSARWPRRLNTELLAPLFTGEGNPMKVATAAAIIGGTVYAIALVLSFLLPLPKEEGKRGVS